MNVCLNNQQRFIDPWFQQTINAFSQILGQRSGLYRTNTQLLELHAAQTTNHELTHLGRIPLTMTKHELITLMLSKISKIDRVVKGIELHHFQFLVASRSSSIKLLMSKSNSNHNTSVRLTALLSLWCLRFRAFSQNSINKVYEIKGSVQTWGHQSILTRANTFAYGCSSIYHWGEQTLIPTCQQKAQEYHVIKDLVIYAFIHYMNLRQPLLTSVMVASQLTLLLVVFFGWALFRIMIMML